MINSILKIRKINFFNFNLASTFIFNLKVVLFLLVLSSLILSSCSKSLTENDTVTFSGTVTLLAPSGEEETDHSPKGTGGVKVLL